MKVEQKLIHVRLQLKRGYDDHEMAKCKSDSKSGLAPLCYSSRRTHAVNSQIKEVSKSSFIAYVAWVRIEMHCVAETIFFCSCI